MDQLNDCILEHSDEDELDLDDEDFNTPFAKSKKKFGSLELTGSENINPTKTEMAISDRHNSEMQPTSSAKDNKSSDAPKKN